jgi:hypothetical protein
MNGSGGGAILRFDPSLLELGDWIEFLAGWDDSGRLITRGERVDNLSRVTEFCIVRAWREDPNGLQLVRYFPTPPVYEDTSNLCYACKGSCLGCDLDDPDEIPN